MKNRTKNGVDSLAIIRLSKRYFFSTFARKRKRKMGRSESRYSDWLVPKLITQVLDCFT